MMKSPIERARAGAAFLDEKLGTSWREKIKRTRLDMACGLFYPDDKQSCGCILAQVDAIDRIVVGSYNYARQDLALSDRKATELGFYDARMRYPALTEAWRQVLREGTSRE
jgi:hypothetical protein